jgi:hypothetical protein
MDMKELEDIRELIELVIFASTKAEAKPHIQRLNFAIANVKPKLDSYLAGKLSEAAGYAAEASGQARNKEHWISCMEQSWYVFKSHVRRKSDDSAVL